MLPKGSSFSKFSKILDQGDLSNQVVFKLAIENNDLEEVNELTSFLDDSLGESTKKYLKDIVIQRSNLEKNVFDYFYRYFSIILS